MNIFTSILSEKNLKTYCTIVFMVVYLYPLPQNGSKKR